MSSAAEKGLTKWGSKGVLVLFDEEVRFYAEKTSDRWDWFTDEIDSFTVAKRPRRGQLRTLILRIEGRDYRFTVGRMFAENARVIFPWMDVPEV